MKLTKTEDSYALITGAASGMGALYAKKLAAMGYNLVLVDINAEKLAATAHECAAVEILQIPINLAQTQAAEQVAAQCEGLCVEVLVNNAGIMYAQSICKTTRRTLSTISLLHMYTPLMLCREFVPKMVERGNGYVLNISSLGAWMNWPAIGMYGATKRFIRDFSRELRIELRGTGVSVTNAYFGAVDTPLIPLPDNLRSLARNLAVMIDADRATDKALRATFARRKGTMPGTLNKIYCPIIATLPDCVPSFIVKKLGKYFLMDV